MEFGKFGAEGLRRAPSERALSASPFCGTTKIVGEIGTEPSAVAVAERPASETGADCALVRTYP
jgi:hypothetical protein